MYFTIFVLFFYSSGTLFYLASWTAPSVPSSTCEQVQQRWTGLPWRPCSAGSTSTPLCSDASGCPWSSSSAWWCLWWQLRGCGVTRARTSSATQPSRAATTSATTASSPSHTSACGPCSSFSSRARHWWWWGTSSIGRRKIPSTAPRTTGNICMPILERSAEGFGGPTW